MIKKPPPFKGLNIRISIIIPVNGMGFLNKGPRQGMSEILGLGRIESSKVLLARSYKSLSVSEL